MFESLSNRLGQVFDRLKRRGSLSEAHINEAMREVRVALLEADVALPVVKDFIVGVTAKAVGQQVLRSVTPGQMVVKIVHDALVEMLGGGSQGLALNAVPPVAVLMVGLQGSGKTTTSAKIGLRLKTRERRKVLLASLDVYRPAAQEQLAILGEQTSIATLPILPGQMPVDIARRAIDEGRKGGFDVVILDTAGRLHIDQALMAEVAEVRDAVTPTEILLVADAMTGQDAVILARTFNEQVRLTGIVLTRIDGDARGGAALSMRAVTGQPIKFLGTGEKLEELEEFHPHRLAGRILGMGDVVSLVEKAAATFQEEDAEAMARKILEGQFDLNDLLLQLRQVRKMGDLKGLLRMLPGIDKLKKKIDESKIDNKLLAHQEAIILSMTAHERRWPDTIKASRKKRIANGCGLTVPDVNRLLKQHQQLAGMMKEMQKMNRKGVLGSLFGGGPLAWPGGPAGGGGPPRLPGRRRR
ncbi:MAG: signal recognition particle subunit SRP54 [Rhodospirillaceae bacterium]|nr:MAG: signal recognition particle subunit SRP54 [Rhodospirillaceae bacterium]